MNNSMNARYSIVEFCKKKKMLKDLASKVRKCATENKIFL